MYMHYLIKIKIKIQVNIQGGTQGKRVTDTSLPSELKFFYCYRTSVPAEVNSSAFRISNIQHTGILFVF